MKEWVLKIFEKSPIEKAQLRHVSEVLGDTKDRKCLVVGGDPAIHHYLYRHDGTWLSAGRNEEAAQRISELTGSEAAVIQEGKLPFEKESVDRIVIVDALEWMKDPYAFVEECHRVLSDSGVLLVDVSHTKRKAILPWIRRALDIRDARSGREHSGYSESDLFDILKDGFDVEESRDYLRFFAELSDTLTQFVAGYLYGEELSVALDGDSPERLDMAYRKTYRFFSLAYPFARLTAVFDKLFFLTRGYRLLARARRRIWRPRKTPVLRDGRSIAEATLGGKIGSAAEF